MVTRYLESSRKEADAVHVEIVKAGTGWMYPVRKGQILRIVDINGNQAVDTIFYNADNTAERYSVQQTVQRQRNALVGVGTDLMSSEDRVMLTVVADTCGDHDTLGSGCSAEGNAIRYTDRTRFMHSCRDTFVRHFSDMPGMSKRDQTCNLNFFTKVQLGTTGSLEFVDGISGPGKYVDLEAKMDVLVLLSNCAQLNNPCNDYNPTPVQMLIWDAEKG